MTGRLVIINDSGVTAGGATKLALDAALGAAGRGWDVTYLTQAGDMDSRLAAASVKVHGIIGARVSRDSPRAAMRTGLWNKAALDAIADFIVQHDTPNTVYHLHNWAHFLSPAIFKALRLVEDRLVLTTHDYFLACGNGGQYDFQKNEVCTRVGNSLPCLMTQCDRHSAVHKVWRVARHAVRSNVFPLKRFRGQVAVIHHRQGPFFERAGLPPERIRTIANPIEPYSTTRIRAEKNESVLFIGRLGVEKGADIAAEAAREAGMKMVFAGSGPMLKDLMRDYPEAHFAGFCNRDQLAALAANARCVIVPSRLAEPFGLVAGEALWSGLPVLISGVAFLSGDIADAGAGLTFDPLEIDTVVAALVEIRDNTPRVKQMSRAAYSNTATLANTLDSWLDAYDGLYRSVQPDPILLEVAS